MSKLLHRVSGYLAGDAAWTKTMAFLVISCIIMILSFVGVVTLKTTMPPDAWTVIKPLRVESSRAESLVNIRYELSIHASDSFTGRFDNQLTCESGAADILDSVRDVQRGNSTLVRHALVPVTIKKGDVCQLEIGITRDIPFSLSRNRKVLAATTFTIN